MSTVLSRQDIINIIYGATVLGAGGGGSASSGLEMLENYIKKHGDPKLRMISTGEMNVNAYAAVTAGMGSPVALKDIDFTPYAVNAYNALVDMAATMGRTLSYTIPVEIGGFNTFVPMLIAMMNDIPVIDADGAARAVPALDTLLLHVNGLDNIRSAPSLLCLYCVYTTLIRITATDRKKTDVEISTSVLCTFVRTSLIPSKNFGAH